MKTIYPNAENCTESELEKYIKISKTVNEKNRLLSIHLLFLGHPVAEVSEMLFVSDTSVYNWIHRFNTKGLDGLLTRHRGVRPRLLSKEDVKERLNVFEEPELVGEVHWTAKKFHCYLQESLQQKLSYTAVLNYLHEQGYALKYGRSWSKQPEGNKERREKFVSEIKELNEDPKVKIWYMDEAGFDGDPRPRRGWHKKGKRKKIYRTQKHLRMNVSGICCPDTGEFFALEFPFSDKTTFQCFLDAANKEVKPENSKKEIMVLDNASWHKVKSLDWGRFQPIFLPPYSPDLNPIERLWAYLKQRFFHSFSAKDLEQLIEQLDFAICSIWNDQKTVSSITA